MLQGANIPLHHFTRDDSDSIAFRIHPLARRNYYDYTIPHRHNYFEIFLFEEGGGKHLIDFEEFDVKDGSIHFVSPGQVHLLKRAPGSFGSLVIFSREFFYKNNTDTRLLFSHPLLHNRTHQPIIRPEAALFQSLMQCVKRMQKEIENESTFREELIRLYLQELLFKSFDTLEQKERQPDLVMQFFSLLETRFYEWHQVQDYANELAVTEKNLRQTLQTHTGKTTQEHIIHRLMLESKRLLRYSDMNIKEIGYRLGFEDPAHFGKFFKRYSEMTPGAFREGEAISG